MLRRLLVSWALMAVAVALTAALLPGIEVDGGIGAFLLIALVWGIVEGLLGPFAFVVNGALFAVTAWVVDALNVDNFLWAILGALVLTVVNFVLSWFTGRAAAHARDN